MVKKKRNLDDLLKVEKCLCVFSKECGQLLEEFQVYRSRTPTQHDRTRDQPEDGNAAQQPDQQSVEQQEQQQPSHTQQEQGHTEQEGTEQVVVSKFYCTSCTVTFTSALEHRLHSKMDWHRFNVRQKSSGKAILTEDMFEAMLSDDCSSISGSDSESDYENMLSRRSEEEEEEENAESNVDKDPLSCHPYKIFLVNPSQQSLFSLHKNIIGNAIDDELIVSNLRRLMSGSGIWVYAMLSAGHFAAAVFQKNEAIVHKTFHRYTVRAKQGTAQGGHDAKNREAKSAGASIRRHNEAALANEIQELLEAWRKHINNAEKIFVKCAPAYNHVFFDEKSGSLRKDDERVVRISLITRRPTLKEVKRLHGLYTSVYVYGSLLLIQEQLARASTTEPKKLAKNTPEKKSTLTVSSPCSGRRSRSPSPGNDPNKNPDCIALWRDAYEHCKNGDLETLTQMLGASDAQFFISDEENITTMTSSEFETRDYLLKRREFIEGGYLNQCGGELAETLLHCAAKCSNSSIISFLMGMGCDPSTRDKRGRLPYNIATSKENRNEFRRFMGKFPSQYDYTAAQIPSPLTEEAESSKKEKEAEKKRQQNKARKQRQKAKKAEEYKEKESEREKNKEADEAAKEAAEFAKLSVREKCALMAERRMADQLAKRCSNCKASLDKIVPFERFEYKYCSMDCVHQHKDVIGK